MLKVLKSGRCVIGVLALISATICCPALPIRHCSLLLPPPNASALALDWWLGNSSHVAGQECYYCTIHTPLRDSSASVRWHIRASARKRLDFILILVKNCLWDKLFREQQTHESIQRSSKWKLSYQITLPLSTLLSPFVSHPQSTSYSVISFDYSLHPFSFVNFGLLSF